MIDTDSHPGQAIRQFLPATFHASVRSTPGLRKLVEQGENKGAMQKKCVLVVDDDSRVLHFVGISLRTAGFEVLTSQTGEQALVELELAVPDLVLLDVRMPGMNGLELLRRLRRFSQVPVLVFSIDDSVVTEVMQIGANDFLSKPVEPNELIGRINKLLSSGMKD